MNFFNSYVFQMAVISALVYAVADFLDVLYTHYLLFGFWVAFQPSIGQDIQDSSKRLLGIVVGGFISSVAMVAWFQSTLSIGIALFLTILFCYAIKKPEILVPAIVAVLMVSIGHYSDGLNQYYWQRFSNNTIGVLLGIVASILLPPPLSAVQLQEGLKKTLIQMGNWYQIVINLHLNLEPINRTNHIEHLGRSVHKMIDNNSRLLKNASLEFSQGICESYELKDLESRHYLTREIAMAIEDLDRMLENCNISQVEKVIHSEVSDLVQTTYHSFQVLGNSRRETQSMTLLDLSEALAVLDRRIEELHETREGVNYDLEEVITFSAFLEELRTIAARLNTLAHIGDR